MQHRPRPFLQKRVFRKFFSFFAPRWRFSALKRLRPNVDCEGSCRRYAVLPQIVTYTRVTSVPKIMSPLTRLFRRWRGRWKRYATARVVSSFGRVAPRSLAPMALGQRGVIEGATRKGSFCGLRPAVALRQPRSGDIIVVSGFSPSIGPP